MLCFLILTACNGRDNSGSAERAAELKTVVQAAKYVVDVRSQSEWDRGHLPNAIHIPYDQIQERVSEIGATPQDTIYLYCASGGRSGSAEKTLKSLGYQFAQNVGGYSSLR